MADETGYRLRLETAVRDDVLTVVPRISAPAARTLRYEITSSKHGKSGRSNTRQSGSVSTDEGGAGTFATLRLKVSPDDRYTVAIKVFDGPKLVAERTLSYP